VIVISRLSEAAVGALFVWAAVLKLLDPQAFVSSILTYEVLGYGASVLAAMVVPYLELTVGTCLVFGVIKRGARLWAFVLLVVFIALLSQAAVRGLDADCGCFGSGQTASDTGYAWPIARDGLMLAGLAIGIVFERLAGVNGRA